MTANRKPTMATASASEEPRRASMRAGRWPDATTAGDEPRGNSDTPPDTAYAGCMSYAAADARRELLEEIAEAISDINLALTALGDAYDQLDDRAAEQLEEKLFRPLQTAYGRA